MYMGLIGHHQDGASQTSAEAPSRPEGPSPAAIERGAFRARPDPGLAVPGGQGDGPPVREVPSEPALVVELLVRLYVDSTATNLIQLTSYAPHEVN